MKLSQDFFIKAAIAAAVVGGAYLFFIVKKNGVGAVAADVAAGAVGVATDAAAGVVVGIGQQVGIPRTDETECEKALREGRTWDASFACPAGTFVKSLFS